MGDGGDVLGGIDAGPGITGLNDVDHHDARAVEDGTAGLLVHTACGRDQALIPLADAVDLPISDHFAVGAFISASVDDHTSGIFSGGRKISKGSPASPVN